VFFSSTGVNIMTNLTHSFKRAKQAGFTLIELIVVIVIIGILAAIAIPKFTGLTGSANTAATQAMAANLTSGAAADFGSTGVAKACTNAALQGFVTPTLPSAYTIGGTAPNCTLTHTNGSTATFAIPQ
jgi:prepilin-type N-terminal cleavage/methylation domain-containing protein